VRRNLATLLEAMLDLRRQYLSRDGLPRLVCAGVDRGIGSSLIAAAASDPDALVLTGAVPEETLINLYRGAVLLAYPSLYEGFGLPVLEAMQCGAPVAVANAASLPEVAGGAGVALDPLNVRAWRDTMLAVWQDAAMRERLRDAGFLQAARFSWSRTAGETLDVLRATAAERRR
jgi:glycosyltransferase involved in cell wall biosynthesis